MRPRCCAIVIITLLRAPKIDVNILNLLFDCAINTRLALQLLLQRYLLSVALDDEVLVDLLLLVFDFDWNLWLESDKIDGLAVVLGIPDIVMSLVLVLNTSLRRRVAVEAGQRELVRNLDSLLRGASCEIVARQALALGERLLH